MAIVSLDEVKTTLRIDYDDEDTFLNLCIEASEIYLYNAVENFETIKQNVKLLPLLKIGALAIVQDFFDNRNYSENPSLKTKKIIDSMILQFQLS